MVSKALQRLRDWDAEIALVLGSGLSGIVGDVDAAGEIAYADFDEISQPTVPGHTGRFVRGTIAGRTVIYAQGRAHLYEGHTAHRATAGIRILADTGVRRLILTNAAGTANPAFPPGSWMALADHLNLTGTSPLLGSPSFIDMTEIYSGSWRAQFAKAANACGITLHEGVYAGLLGPQYETPAEVRMLRQLGADAIGMSTVLEAIQAKALGLEVAGFSCLTNWAAGLGGSDLSHCEVLETGKAAAESFRRLLEASLA